MSNLVINFLQIFIFLLSTYKFFFFIYCNQKPAAFLPLANIKQKVKAYYADFFENLSIMN
ncbi:hypothetical protein CEN39_05880 [Fischerella thermalis CCMEE 5201]|nr:hypothetical protein CEN39_05880 [Fischerella thermalis CCMEE 5201]